MNKKIRVLHTEWSDGWGGQEIRIINEMKVIRSKGVEVFLACRESSIIKEKALDNNIKVFTLGFKGNGDLKTLLALKKYPDKKLVFIIAGDGPQKDNIQNIIKELNLISSVRMVGHVNDTPEFLCALDILVLCSDSKEGVPQSVMQALFMNKSVVASNSGSTEDLIHNNNFQLVKKGEMTALVDGISSCLNQSYKTSTREHMVKYFSSSVMADKIMTTYEKILN